MEAAPPGVKGRGRLGPRITGDYRLFAVVPSASVRCFLPSAILPEGPVEATVRTLGCPLRSARRRLPLASFTFTVVDPPAGRLNRALPSWRTTFRPASLTPLPVRTVSEPAQLPDEPAGQLTLIDAMSFLTL